MGHIWHHVAQRMITHLRKRHKVRDRKTGYARFKPKALYEKYGVYKVPTTAAWAKAHALYGKEQRKALCGKTACTV